MNIPAFLVQTARDKRLVPFVGSGVSLAVKRGLFPTWKQLLERLADQLAAQGKPKQADMVRGHCELDELYDAAQRAAKQLGPALFHDAMRDMFRIGKPADADLSLPAAIWALRPG